MSAEDFQLLLKQLNYGLAEVERQKQEFGELHRKIQTIECNSERDPESQGKLIALQQYQQSDRYAMLREKAEKELLQLQKQCGLLQETVKTDDARSVKKNSQASTGVLITPVSIKNKRNYI